MDFRICLLWVMRRAKCVTVQLTRPVIQAAGQFPEFSQFESAPGSSQIEGQVASPVAVSITEIQPPLAFTSFGVTSLGRDGWSAFRAKLQRGQARISDFRDLRF